MEGKELTNQALNLMQNLSNLAGVEIEDEESALLLIREFGVKSKEKLQAFKDYAHKRLDDAGIEKEPNGEHSQAGCRIGDRLDIVLKKLNRSNPPNETIKRDANGFDALKIEGHEIIFQKSPLMQDGMSVMLISNNDYDRIKSKLQSKAPTVDKEECTHPSTWQGVCEKCGKKLN